MSSRFVFGMAVLSVASLTQTALPSQAQDADKTFVIVVGSAAGGSYDANARLLSRHIGKYLPGHPSVIVRNQPGAASMTAVRSLDLPSAKDGSTIVAFQSGLIGQSRLTPKEVPFDFRKYAWIGSITDDFSACYVWRKPGIDSIHDLKGRKVVFGQSGPGTNADLYARILRNFLGVSLDLVAGYKGGAETSLAIERGELDGQCSSWGSVSADWMDNHRITFLYRSSPKTPPELKELNVPTMMELAANDRDRAIIRALVLDRELARPFITSADVPAERLKILRDAFDQTMRDPEFLADAEKERQLVDPKSSAEATKVVELIYSLPDDIIEAARTVMAQ